MNRVPYYRSRKLRKSFLHVNEYGVFLLSKLKKPLPSKALAGSSFFNDRLDLEGIIRSFSRRFNSRWRGPHTHIISLTGRCLNSCAYCSAMCKKIGGDMSVKTARQIIDFILEIPENEYFVEFTGGEPVLNFEVLKETVSYARQKGRERGKTFFFSVVTSLAYKNERIINFFINNAITVCSSIDGARDIHEANRPLISGGSGFEMTVENIKKIKAASSKGKAEAPNLITTVTSLSMGREKEIVDFYLSLGVSRVQLGMLEPLGRAKLRPDLEVSPSQYLSFYRKALSYILELNLKKRIFIYEKGFYLILHDILRGFASPRRSRDVAHRLAYSFDGGIYPSDEARILGENGDDTFRMGTVSRDDFKKILSTQTSSFSLAYDLNAWLSPRCARCPYSLWCRVPVWYNYSSQNSLWGNMVSSLRCQTMMGVFDLAFETLADKKYLKIIDSWLEKAF